MVNNAEKKNRTKVEDLVKVQGTCVNYQLPTMGASGKYRPAQLTLQDGDKRHAVQDFPVTTEGEFTFRIFPSPLEDCKDKYFEFMVEPSINRTTGVQDTFESQYGTTHKWMAKNLINDPFEQSKAVEQADQGAIEAPEQGSDPKPVVTQDIFAGIDPNQLRIMRQSTLGYSATLLAGKEFATSQLMVEGTIAVAGKLLEYVITGDMPSFDTEVVEDDDVIETLSAEDE